MKYTFEVVFYNAPDGSHDPVCLHMPRLREQPLRGEYASTDFRGSKCRHRTNWNKRARWSPRPPLKNHGSLDFFEGFQSSARQRLRCRKLSMCSSLLSPLNQSVEFLSTLRRLEDVQMSSGSVKGYSICEGSASSSASAKSPIATSSSSELPSGSWRKGSWISGWIGRSEG